MLCSFRDSTEQLATLFGNVTASLGPWIVKPLRGGWGRRVFLWARIKGLLALGLCGSLSL